MPLARQRETKKPTMKVSKTRRLSLWRLGALILTVGVALWAVPAGVERLTPAASESVEGWYAPYVDITLTPYWPFEDPTWNDIDDLVLAFVVADPNDDCEPSWGSAYSLDEAAVEMDLDRRIARYRSNNGQVVISFGGLANNELALTCTDTDDLADAYSAVIERYDAQVIDFDIEGDALDDLTSAQRRAEALALLQQNRRDAGQELHIWLTLPVAASGLLDNATSIIDATLAAGVDLDGINLMTMNFGSSAPDGVNMGKISEEALRAAHRQIGAAYRRADLRLSDTQTWEKLGATPMIGQNDEQAEIFELDDAHSLLELAEEVGLGRISMWSINRDSACVQAVDVRRVSNNCSGIKQTPFEFSTLWAGLPGRPEDRLNRRTVPDDPPEIIDDPSAAPHPIWEQGIVYEEGDRVVWHGFVYRAKWWTRNDLPDEPVRNEWDTPWQLVGPVLPNDRPAPTTTLAPGTYDQWDKEMVYEEGDRVMRDGVGWEAKWWTQGQIPGRDRDSMGQSPWRRLDGGDS